MVWLPLDADDLKVKLLIIAYAGSSGHRGAETTRNLLREHFTWTRLRQDATDFVAGCLFCILSKTGLKIPRPLAMTLHASSPNEVLHFDYLYLGASVDDEKYVLVLKDDLSSYAWIEPTNSASAEHAAACLARWTRTFSAPATWVSDQGGHFINETLRQLATVYNISHRPKIAYTPWTNGTVERLNRDIIAARRALIAELKLGPQDWKSVICILPSILNEAPLSRLGTDKNGRSPCPIQVMTGIVPRRVLLRVVLDAMLSSKPIQLERARAEQRLDIAKLQKHLYELHQDVKMRADTRRRRAIETHNKATNISHPRFEIGDFVLVRQAQKARHKLSFCWAGPRRVVDTMSPLVYVVERWDGSKRDQVHCARMIKYTAALDGTNVPEEVLQLADHTESRYEVLERIISVGKEGDRLWLCL